MVESEVSLVLCRCLEIWPGSRVRCFQSSGAYLFCRELSDLVLPNMPFLKVADEGGHTMTLISYKGRYGSPQFNEEALLNMDDFPLRADDILLCSYSKSGCHWIWEILRLLISGPDSTGQEKIDKESYMMEWRPYDQYSSLPSPRVLNNHMTFDMQPKDLLVKKPKVVFVYRNFKDVAVSFYHHHCGIHEYEYNGDFDSYLKRWSSGQTDNGTPWSYSLGWEKGISEHPELPVFVTSFEDLKQDPLTQVRKLSEYLGFSYQDDFLQNICDLTDFSAMKKRKGPNSFKNKDGNPVMYRKGEVGDWKNTFTVAQSEWLDQMIAREMSESKLTFKYTL
ncbi:sulfotransferase 1A2-like isoform X1 [Biomphalaria glabrata]|uniref:Sulfotransferase 1A2-like isoform X1 n=2 Tax=Biomphalaria glabrata TaxID=6526 RepID=A0A9W2YEC2_BIOGL|nr:sulfotransferase 1A2-like isoform X1 [Biomphalaria glabrata]